MRKKRQKKRKPNLLIFGVSPRLPPHTLPSASQATLCGAASASSAATVPTSLLPLSISWMLPHLARSAHHDSPGTQRHSSVSSTFRAQGIVMPTLPDSGWAGLVPDGIPALAAPPARAHIPPDPPLPSPSTLSTPRSPQQLLHSAPDWPHAPASNSDRGYGGQPGSPAAARPGSGVWLARLSW
jgi:hypothetical protein